MPSKERGGNAQAKANQNLTENAIEHHGHYAGSRGA
jgi:hypothetical protein